MPAISIKLWDIERLVRESITLNEFKDVINNLKIEFEGIEGDEVYIEVSHDRADLFSAEGLGRALRYWLGIDEFRGLNVGLSKEVHLIIDNPPRYRPYVLMSIVRGAKLDDESIRQLFQLQEKLHLTYCDERRLVSIGLYDLDKLKPPVIYKAVQEFTFRPLDEARQMSLAEILELTEKGVMYKHLVKKGEYPILIDSTNTVLSFPPIINSENTRVTENTRNIIIDVTGTELDLMTKVLTLITFSVFERTYGHGSIEIVPIIKGGDLHVELIKAMNPRELTLRNNDVYELLGIRLSISDVVNSLKRLGYAIKHVGDGEVKILIPPFRIDVIGKVDVIEDVAIGYGYDKIATESYPPVHYGEISKIERFSDIIRELMLGLGFDEVVNFMLIDKDFMKSLSTDSFIVLKNPKLKTYSAIRNSLIPSLLISIKRNSDTFPRMKIFEIGDCVIIEKGRAVSKRRLGFAIYGNKVTLTDGLTTVKSLMNALGLKYNLRGTRIKGFIEGRVAEVLVESRPVGFVGELHPEVIVKLGLSKPLVLAEIDLGELLDLVIRSTTSTT